MKNSFIIFLFILIAGNISRFGGPWWAVAPVAALAVLLFPVRPGRAFAIGLAAGSLLWWISALWLNMANGGQLAAKIGQLFQGIRGVQLLALTALLGSLLGGFGALTGAYARAIFAPQKQQRRRRRR